MVKTVLVVEDKKGMADMLSRAFQGEGFAVKTAGTVKAGLFLLAKETIDAVVTDLKLPDGEGFEILKAVGESHPFLPVIVMTAFGNIEIAVRAVKEGAFDFITKPFDPDHLILITKRALAEKEVKKENLVFKKEFSTFLTMPETVGVSKAWLDVMERAGKVAPMKTTVLVLGESGTGKELVARAVHYLSPRSGGPLIAVNCAAIPKDLIENELFGHEKGAFTGAAETKPGRFELADQGTIFLDEIGDMELSLQGKLLRVLQEGEFVRVGGTKSIRIDARVIAASNKDLDKEVSEGRFREDLLYRLNVFPIFVPPLRDRREDIMPLARHFVSFFCKDMKKRVPDISPEAESGLISRQWSGNVRELKNAVERAVIMCDGEAILPSHLGLGDSVCGEQGKTDISLHSVGEEAARKAEKAKIHDALKRTGGNKSKAALLLQVSYKTLLNKIKGYGIT
jgi:DNA-binding NtrC family response regulator